MNILSNRAVKNAGWLIGGKIIQMLVNFAVGILTARFLGPSNMGIIGYAGAYTAFFMSLCNLGINSVLVKEFVDNPENEGTTIGTTLFLRIISSTLSALVIICIVCFINANEPVTIAVVALSSIGLLFNVFETFNYWFQAHLLSKFTAIAVLCGYLITSIYKIILLFLGAKVTFFALATSLDYICVAIFIVIAYYKCGGKKLKVSLYHGKEILSKSKHFILPSLMVSIYGQTDKIMLKQMINEAEVGYYSTAVSICSVWCFVLTAIIDSVYPSIMRANGKDEELFKLRNKQLYAFVFYCSLTVSIIFQIIAPFAIKFLYGNAYIGAINPLRIITWYTAFSYLGVARNAWIVAKNKQKYLTKLYALAAICNVVLNFILIPRFGANGAAVASLSAQLLTSIIIPFFIKPLRENSILMLEGIILKGIKSSKISN